MDVLSGAAGVGGGAPPAAVIIEYCCAIANELLASSKVPHSFPTDLDIYTSSPDRVFEG
jgi:hypothetical protein